jgi:hypothetical protein
VAKSATKSLSDESNSVAASMAATTAPKTECNSLFARFLSYCGQIILQLRHRPPSKGVQLCTFMHSVYLKKFLDSVYAPRVRWATPRIRTASSYAQQDVTRCAVTMWTTSQHIQQPCSCGLQLPQYHATHP